MPARIPPATVLLAIAAIACAGEPLPAGGGVELPEPLPKHDFTLTSTEGVPWRFREATAGRLTFLFFGYTSCPDVCPVQMAGLAAAVRELPPEDQQRVAVVFVTTDPGRDTARAVRAWLDQFDRNFVGLTGTTGEVDAVQRLFGFAPAVREAPRPDGSYLVGHAAQVIAFGVDDTARMAYPFGQRQTDWAPELRRLLLVPEPPASAVPLVPPRNAFPDGFAVAPAGGRSAAAYPVIRSTVALVDTLLAVTSPDAAVVRVYRTAHADGLLSMVPAEGLPLPPGSPMRMALGGTHLMLEGLTRPVGPGDTVTVQLQFRLQAVRTLRLPVRTYAEVAGP
ncbi:MAG TPA: SCO family protein [Gemmatimonadales bacterium]|nr:SCO family protein [Gemmatimonadales bacterium]